MALISFHVWISETFSAPEGQDRGILWSVVMLSRAKGEKDYCALVRQCVPMYVCV